MEAANPPGTRASAGERYAVVAEVHDLVTHDLVQLTVQMAAARRLLADDPVAAGRVLADAEATARAAVDELRRTAVLLPSPDAGRHRPLPGLADLDELVTVAATAGVQLDVRRAGALPAVRAATELGAYRAVEDAVRHAARGSRVGVVVTRDADGLRVEVHRTDPAGADRDELCRRMALYGGRLRYFPGEGGRLTVDFPLERTEPG